jgi:uncharacterized protein involved in exopolysaccharide biosynthesis
MIHDREFESHNGHHNGLGRHSKTLRDYAGIYFRHRRLATLAFFGTLLGVTLVSFLYVAKLYKSEMQVLVKHQRTDPLITPRSVSELFDVSNDIVSEEEVNNEVNLLQAEDLLRKVVLDTGLQNRQTLSYHLFRWAYSPDEWLEHATRKLAKDLKVEAETKTHLIDVTYRSDDPRVAANVLSSLAKFYMEKHLEVHRPPKALDFFEKETADYQKQLADSETKLADYDRSANAVSSELEKDSTVQKIADFTANLGHIRANVGATQRQIQDLEQQLGATPSRLKTQEQSTDAYMLLDQDKSTLLNLELKRTELLTKYDPSHPLVQQVEQQIVEARAAVAQAEKEPTVATTTDHDPTYELLREELAKSKASLAMYQGQEEATLAVLRDMRVKAVDLDDKALMQKDLLRAARADEDNYLLYRRKREEARISDAMDTQQMVNVAVAQPPTAPSLPILSPWLVEFIGVILAVLMAIGSVFAADYLTPSFQTPDEVTEILEVPIFASIPRN